MNGDPIGKIAWKPLIFIIGANLVFGALLGGIVEWNIPAMGLIAAIFALVLIASLAGENISTSSKVSFSRPILAIGSYLAFVVALNLQFQVWPTFITG